MPRRSTDPFGADQPRFLYRGLTRPYDSTYPVRGGAGTDFTDCPYTALLYAKGTRGAVLVVDVTVGEIRLSEELWVGPEATRYMIWGPFEHAIVARIPAKELRAQVRQRGVVAASDEYKSELLERYVEARLRDGQTTTRRAGVGRSVTDAGPVRSDPGAGPSPVTGRPPPAHQPCRVAEGPGVGRAPATDAGPSARPRSWGTT